MPGLSLGQDRQGDGEVEEGFDGYHESLALMTPRPRDREVEMGLRPGTCWFRRSIPVEVENLQVDRNQYSAMPMGSIPEDPCA